MKLGLYIHIPFCIKKCLYCNFPSFAGLEYLYYDYSIALINEIKKKKMEISQYTIDTIYIGGGTPTVLTGKLFNDIFNAIFHFFNISKNVEISIEANPGTINKNYLKLLKQCCINRLSIGVQSFDDKILKNIGRIHSQNEAMLAINSAIDVGFTNVNIDLMYGLPGQTLFDFLNSLKIGAQSLVSHISVYGLMIEEGTPLESLKKFFNLNLPNENEEVAMYELTQHFLKNKGFIRYEISNYSRPNKECRHNLKYWQYKPYIGIGAYAHSFFEGERRINICNIKKYIKYAKYGYCLIETFDKIDRITSMTEYIFLVLRTKRGLSFDRFSKTFNVDLRECYSLLLNNLEKQKLIGINSKYFYLTEKGMKFSNYVFRCFLPD